MNSNQVSFIDMNGDNLCSETCFCLRSQKKNDGYINKKNWLTKRMEEGLKYITLKEGDKLAGFIEYTPSEASWRTVYAENCLIIHCLWVSATGKGYASMLIEKCIQDAKVQKKDAVVVITNDEISWTPGREIFEKNGFVCVDETLENFKLYCYQINEQRSMPAFPVDWEQRLQKFDKGITILKSYQCPYLDIAEQNVLVAADKLQLKVKTIYLTSREDVMNLSPTPYGVYAVIYNGKLVTYHRLTPHGVIKRIKEINQ